MTDAPILTEQTGEEIGHDTVCYMLQRGGGGL